MIGALIVLVVVAGALIYAILVEPELPVSHQPLLAEDREDETREIWRAS